jgi:hypothetical protein
MSSNMFDSHRMASNVIKVDPGEKIYHKVIGVHLL